MKKTLFTLFILFNSFLFSQSPITRTLGEFKEIKVYDLINVDLIKSSENRITISGKYAEDVNVIQKNNTLKIRMKLKKMFMQLMLLLVTVCIWLYVVLLKSQLI